MSAKLVREWFTCRCCNTEFEQEVVRDLPESGRKHTDFHESFDGDSFLCELVLTCPHCWFSTRLADDAPIPQEVRDYVLEEVRGPLTPSERWELVAKLDPMLGYDLWSEGGSYRTAAYAAAELEADHEAERYFRIKAVECWMQLLESFNDVPREARATVTFCVAEMWRRIGHEARAKLWFAKVADEIIDSQSQWLRKAVDQQSSPRAKEYFG